MKPKKSKMDIVAGILFVMISLVSLLNALVRFLDGYVLAGVPWLIFCAFMSWLLWAVIIMPNKPDNCSLCGELKPIEDLYFREEERYKGLVCRKCYEQLYDSSFTTAKSKAEEGGVKEGEKPILLKPAPVKEKLLSAIDTNATETIEHYNKEGVRESDEALSVADVKATENIKHYDKMEGVEFEHFCADILRQNGFTNTKVSKGSGDYGVDILADKDGVLYAIQCKRSASNVGNKAVQEIYSGKSFYRRHVGVVLTNQYFTSSAQKTAKQTGVLLWDREHLKKLVDNVKNSTIHGKRMKKF